MREKFEQVFQKPDKCSFDVKKGRYVGDGFGYSQKAVTDYNMKWEGWRLCYLCYHNGA